MGTAAAASTGFAANSGRHAGWEVCVAVLPLKDAFELKLCCVLVVKRFKFTQVGLSCRDSGVACAAKFRFKTILINWKEFY